MNKTLQPVTSMPFCRGGSTEWRELVLQSTKGISLSQEMIRECHRMNKLAQKSGLSGSVLRGCAVVKPAKCHVYEEEARYEISPIHILLSSFFSSGYQQPSYPYQFYQ
jgi:hypothetical protein